MSPGQPVIVTPLAYEQRALARAGLGRRAQLACCGPGAEAIARWVRLRSEGPETLVILAGLAGGLDERRPPGAAFAASAVVDGAGRRWEPSLAGPRGTPAAVIVASTTVAMSPERKRALALETGAGLADLESAAFAAGAAGRGWRWAVVRGVSDGPLDRLPAGVDRWVDARGRTRPAKVWATLLRRPGDAGCAARLAQRSRQAMAAVARVLEAMLNDGHG